MKKDTQKISLSYPQKKWITFVADKPVTALSIDNEDLAGRFIALGTNEENVWQNFNRICDRGSASMLWRYLSRKAAVVLTNWLMNQLIQRRE